MVSFVFIPSSLFSFVFHFVAFDSSSCSGGSGVDVVVVVVVVDVVLVTHECLRPRFTFVSPPTRSFEMFLIPGIG